MKSKSYESVSRIFDVFSLDLSLLVDTEKDLVELLSPGADENNELGKDVYKELNNALDSNQTNIKPAL